MTLESLNHFAARLTGDTDSGDTAVEIDPCDPSTAPGAGVSIDDRTYIVEDGATYGITLQNNRGDIYSHRLD